MPGEEQEDFLILRSFVPSAGDQERKELTAFMVAKSDPENYGDIEVFEMQSADIAGPAIVGANILSDEQIASEVTLLDQRGSEAIFGNLLLIPVEESILYVRPLYTQAEGSTAVPLLRQVIVAYGDRIEMRDTLFEALEAIFGESPETREDPRGSEDEPGEEPPDGEEPPAEEPGEEDVAALLLEADRLFQEADEALAESDLEEYARLIEDARDLIEQAVEASGGSSSTTTTTIAPAAA